MKATHKKYDATVGLQVIQLMPGQFIFGRKKAADDTGLTEREIRTIIDHLKNTGNLTIKTTNKFSIITVMDSDRCQSDKIENDQTNDKPMSNKCPHTNTEEQKNKKTLLDFLSEISALKKRYLDQDSLDRVFQAISSTRKSQRIKDSVTLRILLAWEAFTVDQVMDGISTYLSKQYHLQGKSEEYLLGIIKNNNGNGKQKSATTPVFESSGSQLLDAYRRGEIKLQPVEGKK